MEKEAIASSEEKQELTLKLKDFHSKNAELEQLRLKYMSDQENKDLANSHQKQCIQVNNERVDRFKYENKDLESKISHLTALKDELKQMLEEERT